MNIYGFNSSVFNNDVLKDFDAVEQTINLPLDFRHAMIVGETGCGKTTSAILPILNNRIQKGHGILMFDYKGAEHLKVKALAKKHNRLKDVVMINVPWGKNINFIEAGDPAFISQNLEKIYLTSNNNDFWAKCAGSYLSGVISMLSAMRNIALSLNNFLPNSVDEIPQNTIKVVLEKLNSPEKFFYFYRDVKAFYNKYLCNEISSYIAHLPKNIASKILREFYAMRKINKPKFEKFLNENEIFSKFVPNYNEGPTALFTKNITAMFASLNRVADIEYINKDENSLFEMLNSGKIVIVNCDNLDNAILAILLSATLDGLTKRCSLNIKTAISIIIDEAQKVLCEGTDLHADVLRESQTELILAFQNEDLMKTKIGTTQYSALKQNLTHKFIYKNQKSDYFYESYNLKQFECYNNDNKKLEKMKPIFLDKNELDKAELCFQKINGVFNKFASGEYDENSIVVYDSNLFRNEAKVILKNIKSKEIKNIPSLSNEEAAMLLESLKNLRG